MSAASTTTAAGCCASCTCGSAAAGAKSVEAFGAVTPGLKHEKLSIELPALGERAR